MTYQQRAAVLAGLTLVAAGVAGCGGKPQQPATTVDGSVAYAVSSGGGSAAIDVMDAGVTKTLEKDGLSVGADPAWSPHAEAVAYVTDKHQVAVVKKDGTLGVLIGPKDPEPSASPTQPAWLPNGTLSYVVGGTLHVVQPTGQQVRSIRLKAPDGTPLTGVGAYAWSPDGTQLMFVCGTGAKHTICVQDLKSGTVRSVLEPQWAFGSLDYSPDGSTVVAGNGSGSAHPVPDVYTFSVTGRDLRALAQPGQESDPAWSPDGLKILFASMRDKDSGLWLMPANGSGSAEVLVRQADARHPDWTAP